MTCGMQTSTAAAAPSPGRNVLSTLFSYSHPRSWRADGIPPDGYHPGQLFSPLRGARVRHLPSLPPPPPAHAGLTRPKNRDDFTWWKKKKTVKKPQASFSGGRMFHGNGDDWEVAIVGDVRQDRNDVYTYARRYRSSMIWQVMHLHTDNVNARIIDVACSYIHMCVSRISYSII